MKHIFSLIVQQHKNTGPRSVPDVMLKNTLKEIKVRDYWKGTKAASLRWVALLGIWAVTGIAAIPFV